MNFEEFLIESPLPDDWDTDVYRPGKSFKSQLEYALARAKKLGSGSARVAFEIEYKGRTTVLKIAKNAKGLAQNEEEAALMSEPYLPEIVIPMIDYDEENGQPRWIHLEKAEKASEKKLCKLLNVPDLFTLIRASTEKSHRYYPDNSSYVNTIKTFNDDDDAKMEIVYEYINGLKELEQSYNVELADFQRAANWGLYKGAAVIIDLGYTENTAKLYR